MIGAWLREMLATAWTGGASTPSAPEGPTGARSDDMSWSPDTGTPTGPMVNIDGTPMLDGYTDIKGNPFGVTDTWSQDTSFDHGSSSHEF